MGQSSQNTQSTQQSSTAPWSTAMPTVSSIIGQLNPLIGNSGLTSPQQTAINQLTTNAQAGNPYAPQIGANATTLLAGGGATNQAGAVNDAYKQYFAATNPLASNTNYDPSTTPGFAPALSQIATDVTNQVNGQFAAAGRDGSPANTTALARGIAAGEAPVIAGQYNANVANQQGAAKNLVDSAYGSNALLSGMQQQDIANRTAGTDAAGNALTAANWGPTSAIAAENLRNSIPAQNLGLLANIGLPIASLGTNSSGTGTSNTTSNPSLLSQLGQLGGLFSAPAGGASAIAGMGNAAAGLGSAGSAGLSSLMALLAL